MSQRVGVILLASFVTCFVGSCAVGTLTLVQGLVESIEHPAPPPIVEPDLSPSRSEPPSSEPDDPLTTPEPAAPEPTDTASSDDFFSPSLATAEYAVFHVDRPKKDPLKTLRAAVKGTRLTVYEGAAPDEAIPPYLTLRVLTTDEYPLATGATLDDGAWLPPALKKSVKASKEVSVIDAVLPPHELDALLSVDLVMLAYATATGGALWDEESQNYYGPADWKARRIASWDKKLPDALNHFTVFTDANDRTETLKTSGLNQFALPELELKGVPVELESLAISMVNALAQTTIEAGAALQPGPHTLRLGDLKHRTRREDELTGLGDDAQQEVELILVGKLVDDEPVLELTFPGAGAPGDRIAAGLQSLYGTQN